LNASASPEPVALAGAPAVYQAAWLLAFDETTASPVWLKDGWLRVENGRITALGSGTSLPADLPIQTLPGTALLPGLVNAHCHLELTTLHDRLDRGKPFPVWVDQLRGFTAGLENEDYRHAARVGVQRLLEGGCTTVLDVGNTGEALGVLADSALRSFACVETLGLDPAHAETRFASARALATRRAPTDRFHPGVAPHAAYSCSKELLRFVMEYQNSNRLPWTIHAAESREEADLFESASGPMQDFCVRIFRGAPTHHGTTPVGWLESEGLLPDGALIIHGNHLDAADMDILVRRKATVVHCPSSHAFFGHKPFPWQALRARGIPVCLGTDSLASADSLSMLDQMRLFSERFPEVAPEEIIRMTASGAARALGLGGITGSLTIGYAADFIAVTMPEGPLRPASLFRADAKVEKTVIGGRPVTPRT
jgi:cytosine/adenosine deaminase-related metal-dependent hydrolase